jgi:hypothetical protein
MKRNLVISALCLILCSPLWAACSGASPSWTAASASQSDIQACITAASSGDTINLPATNGITIWTSQLNPSGKTLYFSGSTQCSANCAAGSGNGGTYSDNSGTCSSAGTCIELNNTSAAALLLSCTSSNFISWGYTTFIMENDASETTGNIVASGTFGSACFRLHHLHVIMPTSSATAIIVESAYGLLDHIYFNDTTTSGAAAVPIVVFGNIADNGYSNWNAASQIGTNQALYLEDFTYTTTQTNTEGLFDGYGGARVVVRYGTVTGNELGGLHGYDSGGKYRSGMLVDINNLNISASGWQGEIMNSRGGMVLFHNNSVGAGTWTGLPLHYYRQSQPTDTSYWGVAVSPLNWIPDSTTPGSYQNNSLNAPAFVSGNSYSANSVVWDTNGCNLLTTAGGTSGSQPSCQTEGLTTTDSGGVVWQNVGGIQSTSVTTAGFCAANPDTMCSSNSVCSALSSGDTCTRHVDASGGYPYRDQPCVGNNQVPTPCFAWGNTGSGLPSSVFGVDSPTPLTLNVDYYQNTAMPGYVAYTYPHPLQGIPPSAPTSLTATPVAQ